MLLELRTNKGLTKNQLQEVLIDAVFKLGVNDYTKGKLNNIILPDVNDGYASAQFRIHDTLQGV